MVSPYGSPILHFFHSNTTIQQLNNTFSRKKMWQFNVIQKKRTTHLSTPSKTVQLSQKSAYRSKQKCKAWILNNYRNYHNKFIQIILNNKLFFFKLKISNTVYNMELYSKNISKRWTLNNIKILMLIEHSIYSQIKTLIEEHT